MTVINMGWPQTAFGVLLVFVLVALAVRGLQVASMPRFARSIRPLSGRFFLLFFVCLLPPAVSAEEMSEQFWAAARKGDAARVRELLARGVDVNTKFRYDQTALFYAAERGHSEVVKVLLDYGANVNIRQTLWGSTPLEEAASRGHTAIVEMLLAKGAEGVDKALWWAAHRGHVETVKAVLAHEVKTEALTSALATATTQGHADIAELLKKAGATPPLSPDFHLDSQTLRTYSGLYKSDEGMEFSFVVKEGKLTGGNIFEDPWAWEPVDKVTFQPAESEWVTITFTLEGQQVAGFKLKRRRDTVTFRKVDQK